jgi:hypothetical protein
MPIRKVHRVTHAFLVFLVMFLFRVKTVRFDIRSGGSREAAPGGMTIESYRKRKHGGEIDAFLQQIRATTNPRGLMPVRSWRGDGRPAQKPSRLRAGTGTSGLVWRTLVEWRAGDSAIRAVAKWL